MSAAGMHAGGTLAGLTPGFSDPVGAAQAVFRLCLERLSRPGTPAEVRSDAALPVGLHAASGALLLALLDQDTRLWLSPAAAGAAAYLRFHTGCVPVDDPAEADFALAASVRELPQLERFAQGSEDYPDRSTTLIVKVESLATDAGWTLRGPGIADSVRLSAAGLGAAFALDWAANRRRFPCGVDVFLASGSRLAGLPRTTRLEDSACT